MNNYSLFMKTEEKICKLNRFKYRVIHKKRGTLNTVVHILANY